MHARRQIFALFVSALSIGVGAQASARWATDYHGCFWEEETYYTSGGSCGADICSTTVAGSSTCYGDPMEATDPGEWDPPPSEGPGPDYMPTSPCTWADALEREASSFLWNVRSCTDVGDKRGFVTRSGCKDKVGSEEECTCNQAACKRVVETALDSCTAQQTALAKSRCARGRRHDGEAMDGYHCAATGEKVLVDGTWFTADGKLEPSSISYYANVLWEDKECWILRSAYNSCVNGWLEEPAIIEMEAHAEYHGIGIGFSRRAPKRQDPLMTVCNEDDASNRKQCTSEYSACLFYYSTL